MCNTELIQKLENIILNNIRKIDIFTNDLRKVYVKWNNERYDPFYNINNLNDVKTAENMIKNIIILAIVAEWYTSNDKVVVEETPWRFEASRQHQVRNILL